MKKERYGINLGVGSTSLLAIFVILCLIAFGALSFATAKADVKLAEKTAAVVTFYYDAENEAEEILFSLANSVKTGTLEDTLAANDGAYQSVAGGFAVVFEVPIDDKKALRYEATIAPSGEVLSRVSRVIIKG